MLPSNGCSGGYLDSFARYASTNGVAFENVYPYNAASSLTACAENTAKIATGQYRVKNFLRITNCNMLTDIIVNHGPVTVCMTADNNWQGYVSGVIPSCSNSNSGHCVLLTGASSDGIQYFQSALNPLDATVLNKNFWRFRNSWGTSWGEAGYFRSFRNGSISDSGYCGFCRQGLITLPN